MKSFYFIFNRILAFLLLFLLSPFFILIIIIIKITSSGPVIFKQQRVGHNGKIFLIYKFRTMVKNAEYLKKKYTYMNHAEKPVFKIRNDPRFVGCGRFLSDNHLDELPQFFNVLKGEMLIVGYRPPILDEVKQYSKKYLKRFNGYPGITSLWAIQGGHERFTFSQWIKSDIEYEKKRSLLSDVKIILKTFKLFFKYFNKRKY